MVQAPAEDFSALKDDEAVSCDTKGKKLVTQGEYESRMAQKEPSPADLHLFECCFTTVTTAEATHSEARTV